MTRFLIENGADINLADKRGRTALHVAVANSNLHKMNFILQKLRRRMK